MSDDLNVGSVDEVSPEDVPMPEEEPSQEPISAPEEEDPAA